MTASLRFLLDHIPTPIGHFAILADEEGFLRAAGFTEGHARMERELQACARQRTSLIRASNPHGFSAAIERYFAGDLAAIDRLPVAVDGTDFQRAVWQALREVPCGETWSYADLARHIGRPTAVRAVGLANGANPVGLVVPCHRVIGSNGSMTGYGGGIERKRWLLAHERRAESGTQLDLDTSLAPSSRGPDEARGAPTAISSATFLACRTQSEIPTPS
jgi:methylated-DNA-[protein]-cysteine S-methyltransferase